MMHSHVVVMINNGLMISERWPRENCFTGTEKKRCERLYFMWKLLGKEGQIFDDITEFKLYRAFFQVFQQTWYLLCQLRINFWFGEGFNPQSGLESSINQSWSAPRLTNSPSRNKLFWGYIKRTFSVFTLRRVPMCHDKRFFAGFSLYRIWNFDDLYSLFAGCTIIE